MKPCSIAGGLNRLLSLTMVCACTSVSPDPVTPDHPNPKFKATMKFTADGVPYEGVAFLQRKTSIRFQFQLPKSTSLFILDTCGREKEWWNPDSSKPFEYVYIPGMWVENIDSCMLVASAVTTQGEYYRAAIDFTNSNGRDLEAQVFCNGEWIKGAGAYFCQSRQGIITRVKFLEDTVQAGPKECPEMKEVGFREYESTHGFGFCSYDFMSKDRKTFRFTTLGYTSILNIFPTKK